MAEMPITARIPGNYQWDGVVCKNADLNSVEKTIDDTAATYTLTTLAAGAEVWKLKYIITENFNGTLKLGNGDDDEAYIANADFPKTGSGVVIVGVLLTAAAVVKLTVSGCTQGAGWFKLVWEV